MLIKILVYIELFNYKCKSKIILVKKKKKVPSTSQKPYKCNIQI